MALGVFILCGCINIERIEFTCMTTLPLVWRSRPFVKNKRSGLPSILHSYKWNTVLCNNKYRTLILSKYIDKILTWINKAKFSSTECEVNVILLKRG